MRTTPARSLALAFLLSSLSSGPARAYDVVLSAQGEYVDAYLINGTEPPPRVAFVDPDPPDPASPTSHARIGRHLNGQFCFMPRQFARGAAFVMADDTYREACLDQNPPQARCAKTHGRDAVGTDPDGWGIFRKNGRWARRHIHVPWSSPGAADPGNTDPQGCIFLSNGVFIGTDVGSGNPGQGDGSLVAFFPGPRKRYDTYCFIKKATLSQPGMILARGNDTFMFAEEGGGMVHLYAPPFPTSEADCANAAKLVTVSPTITSFAVPPEVTPGAIAAVPNSTNVYITSTLLPQIVNEYTSGGTFVRTIAPMPTNPLGIGVGSDHTVYFSELHLSPTFSTGCGSVSRVRFNASNQPQAQEVLSQNLLFPDGITVIDSTQLHVRWERLPASPNNDPSVCTPE